MSNIQGKIWGSTQKLLLKNNVEIHRLEVKSGGICSKHCHLHKHNLFFLEKGNLKVSVWQTDYDLIDVTILNNGQSTIVKPGLYHQFEAIEDSILYEIYYTELLDDDIVRENVGTFI